MSDVNVYQPSDSLRNEIAGMAEGKAGVYSSIKGQDFASKKQVVQAVTGSSPLREHLGEVIRLRNFVVQAVPMENEQTKVIEDQPRVILIDEDGRSYHAISRVVLKDMQNITGILGQPDTWPEPVEIAVSEERSNGARRFMTINLV